MMLGQPDVPWGGQTDKFAGAMAWTLPNPSGLNRSFSLADLVTGYSELRRALSEPRGL
jgi:double-stranded uracil-DNA glycosylase